MQVLKIMDIGDVLGSVTQVGAHYRVEILQGESIRTKEFASYVTAERWLKSMVVTVATGETLKRGSGGRAKPLAHDRSPALGSAPRSPESRRLKHQRAS